MNGSLTLVTIGVTGPRVLDDEARLARQVEDALSQIQDRVSDALPSKVRFRVLSPLAEGADRLVAKIVLTRSDAQLDVVLPLPEADYMRDFELPASKAEFEGLLSRARRIERIGAKPSREEAYEAAGRHVVDHCDALIALWDGTPASGRGGTAEIVQYARDRGCPLYWIHSERDLEIVEELGRGLGR